MRGLGYSDLNVRKIATILANARAKIRLPRNVAAGQIGIAIQTLERIEWGHNFPALDTFWMICQFYDLDPTEVLKEASK